MNMSKGSISFLIYQKDFSEKSIDRYFIYDGDCYQEVTALQVASIDHFLVTHDFWLISTSLYKHAGGLPKKVIGKSVV